MRMSGANDEELSKHFPEELPAINKFTIQGENPSAIPMADNDIFEKAEKLEKLADKRRS